MPQGDGRVRCSFCGKDKNQVAKFISGPSVYICNECIMLGSDILKEDELKEAGMLGNLRIADIRLASELSESKIPEILEEILVGNPKTVLGLLSLVLKSIETEASRIFATESDKLKAEIQAMEEKQTKVSSEITDKRHLLEKILKALDAAAASIPAQT